MRWLFVILLFTSCVRQASDVLSVKEDVPNVNRSIPEVVKCSSLDRLGNIYIVNDRNEIRKYDQDGRMLQEYFNARLGDVHSIDTANPLQVRVFYRDYQYIVILDSTLGVIKELDLSASVPQLVTQQVAVSNDDGMWLYDESSQRVYKVREDFTRVYQTDRLTDLTEESITPSGIVEKGNYLFVPTTNGDLWVFDNFGQFIKKIVFDNRSSSWFFFKENKLYYTQSTSDNTHRLIAQDLNGVGLWDAGKSFVEVPKDYQHNSKLRLVSYRDGVDIEDYE